mgnify:FL=1
MVSVRLTLHGANCTVIDAMDCVLKRYTVYLEDTFNCVRASGNKTRGTIVIDVSNCGFSNIPYIHVIKRLSKIGITNYPEINDAVYLLNVNWIVVTG